MIPCMSPITFICNIICVSAHAIIIINLCTPRKIIVSICIYTQCQQFPKDCIIFEKKKQI